MNLLSFPWFYYLMRRKSVTGPLGSCKCIEEANVG